MLCCHSKMSDFEKTVACCAIPRHRRQEIRRAMLRKLQARMTQARALPRPDENQAPGEPL